MNQGFTRDGVLLGVASLAVAMLLWLQVSLQNQPSKQREFEVPLEVRNLPDHLVIIPPKTTSVRMVGEGGPDLLDAIQTKELSAFVDLADATDGRRTWRVQWSAPNRYMPYLTLNQSQVSIALARKKTIQRAVKVVRFGSLPRDLLSDGGDDQVEPRMVNIAGSEQDVARVKDVAASLDLTRVRINGAYAVKVQVLDEDGKAISGLEVSPETVTIRPVTAPAPADRGLLVVPNWKGQPAFGYRVKDYEVVPKQVQLQGSPDIVSRYSTVETEPVDLTGLKATTVLTVKLKRFGTRIGTLAAESVKIKVVIEAAPVETAPTDVPPPAGN
ncbi:MAG: hypothetical protein K1X67_17740 [Fimbriimonadaceae bacterium]|nr:hypothetical protein [Fimbriimonadaceae bacterium]